MEQLKLLQGEVENEKKERAAVESERNKVSQMGTVDQLNALFSIVVCLLYHQHLLLLLLRQLQSQLQGLQRQSAVLMTSVSDDEKLTDALLQLEQMQKELQEEKSSSAAKAN